MDTNEHAEDTNANTDFTNIVGVFRDRERADQAMEALRQAHLSDEQPSLTIYQPQVEGEERPLQPNQEREENSLPLTPSDTRYLVHIRAEGKEQEAVGILVSHGSNNSDLPPGTALVNGSIVSEGQEADTPKTPPPEATPDDLFSGGDDTEVPIPRIG